VLQDRFYRLQDRLTQENGAALIYLAMRGDRTIDRH
jgi:hypothetical protein